MDLEETIIVRYFLDKALATLTEREQLVLKMVYYDKDTQGDIAKHILRCRNRVYQIKEKALRRLRHPSRSGQLEGAPYWRKWEPIPLETTKTYWQERLEADRQLTF